MPAFVYNSSAPSMHIGYDWHLNCSIHQIIAILTQVSEILSLRGVIKIRILQYILKISWPMFGITISNLYLSKCLKRVDILHIIIPSTHLREVEANPFEMKGPIFGQVKIRALASFFFFMALFWMALLK